LNIEKRQSRYNSQKRTASRGASKGKAEDKKKPEIRAGPARND
jgi:hypothetical protein